MSEETDTPPAAEGGNGGQPAGDVLLKVTDLLVGVRANEAQEIEGLDLTEHGEEAYNLEM